MSLVFRLAAFLVFIIVEAASLALTSIWFAGGALAALIIAAVGSSVKIQLTLFALVSGILLVCVRPAAKKLVNQRTQKTNARGLYGKPVRITEDVECQVDRKRRCGRHGVDRAGRGPGMRNPRRHHGKNRRHPRRQADR